MTQASGKTLPPVESSRPLPAPARVRTLASVPADRSFKVLQPSRAPAQLPLFPPPGLVRRVR